METNRQIAIIGAGLTGLTTAFYLKEAGFNVRLFEKEERAGGVIKTLSENGFLFECGPNSGVLSHPEALELLEALHPSCQLEVADQAAKFRWVWKGSQWHALPSGFLSAVTTPLFSLYDKFRILGEPFRKAGTNPNETLSELVLRRMGKSFLHYAVDPFILGIYAGDPALLIPRFALPKLYNLEQKYGSFVGGTIKKAKEPKSERDKKATREIFSVQGGLQNLIDALADRIGADNISLNCAGLEVSKVARQKFGLKVNGLEAGIFDNVIITSGAHTLPGILPWLPEKKMDDITALKYAPVIQVSLGFNKWEGVPLKAFGGLVPYREKRDILGVLFISSIFRGRAPEKGALLSVFLGGIRRPDIITLSDDKVMEVVERELKSMMKLDSFRPGMVRIHRYSHAIPQYGIESEKKLAAIEAIEKEFPGLMLAGNARDGIGMADRIRQGKNIAQSFITGS